MAAVTVGGVAAKGSNLDLPGARRASRLAGLWAMWSALVMVLLIVPAILAAIALPAYIATEVITRGLIALRDTRTPLLTNTGQLVGRVAVIVALLPAFGVLAIPAAFAITSTLETLTLGAVLWRKLARAMPDQPAGPLSGEMMP